MSSSQIFEQLSGQIAETLRRAFEDANISIDELSALSGVEREEIIGVLFGNLPASPKTSAVLAAVLGGRLGELRLSNQALARRA